MQIRGIRSGQVQVKLSRMRLRVLCVFGLVILATLVAHRTCDAQEQRYEIASWSVGSIDPDPSACSAQIESVRQTLSDFNLPVSHQFAWVVLCDEKTWFGIKNSAAYRRVPTNTGFTDFRNHVVYLKGFKQTTKDLRDTVGHEIGHQICRCNDESTANTNKFRLLGSAQMARK